MQQGKFRSKPAFVPVPLSLLRNQKLSLKAKGLYSLIQSYITIPNFTLYKSYLLSQCTEGESSFNTGWNELKDNGYLKIYKVCKLEEKGFYYEYELLDEPDLESPALVVIDKNGEIVKKDINNNSSEDSVTVSDNIIDSKMNEEPNPTEDAISNNCNESESVSYDETVEKVNEQIDYDSLIVSYSSKNKDYMAELVNNMRDIIVEILLLQGDSVQIGQNNHNINEVKRAFIKITGTHIERILYNLSNLYDSGESITYPKKYLLSALYNSVSSRGIENLQDW